MHARCTWCGDIEIEAGQVRCAVDPHGDRALVELTCPSCSRLVLLAVSAARAASRMLGGARPMTGPIPFELLERHTGPRLTMDDLLDLHLEIERMDVVG